MIGGAAGPFRLKLPLPFRTTDARTFSEVLEGPGHAKNPKLSLHEMLPCSTAFSRPFTWADGSLTRVSIKSRA